MDRNCAQPAEGKPRTRHGYASGVRQVLKNPLLRLMAINWVIGAFTAALITTGLLALDTAGLRTLLSHAEDPFVPLALLFGGLLVTFSSVAMGTAIMALPTSEPRGGGKNKADGVYSATLIPARARAQVRRQR